MIQGVVASDRMAKSITVSIERVFRHPKYGKYIKRHEKIHAHDEANDARVGDKVELMESRPLSKSKRWRLLRVIERASLPTGGVPGGGGLS